jgi:dephospho-CoA kinase
MGFVFFTPQIYYFMLKIGLTGGIGSGKSTVANIFKVLGIPVFDADSVAKQLMNDNIELKEKLTLEFGNETYKDGILDKKYLSNIVFNNSFKLEKLNAIVHPIAIEVINCGADLGILNHAVCE